jgi:energy-coupling factor transport system substrate-specific component
MAQRTDIVEDRGPARPWSVGTREVVYMAIGAALYGLFSWATSGLRIPGPFNSSVRPGVAIPLFFGAAFGPVVGFFTGFVGNIIGDLLSGYGFSFNWSLGNGLMGLVAGLASYYVRRLDNPRAIAIAVGFALLGIVVGIGFAAFTDIWAYGITLDASWAEFVPVAVTNAIAAIILVPLLAVAYEAVRNRSGQAA